MENEILTKIDNVLKGVYAVLSGITTYDSSKYDILEKGQAIDRNGLVISKNDHSFYSFKFLEPMYLKSSKSTADNILSISIAEHDLIKRFSIEFNSECINRIHVNSGDFSVQNNPDEVKFLVGSNAAIIDSLYFRNSFISTDDINFSAEITLQSQIVSIRKTMQNIFDYLK